MESLRSPIDVPQKGTLQEAIIKIEIRADLDGSRGEIRTLVSMKGKIFEACLKNVDYKCICEPNPPHQIRNVKFAHFSLFWSIKG